MGVVTNRPCVLLNREIYFYSLPSRDKFGHPFLFQPVHAFNLGCLRLRHSLLIATVSIRTANCHRIDTVFFGSHNCVLMATPPTIRRYRSRSPLCISMNDPNEASPLHEKIGPAVPSTYVSKKIQYLEQIVLEIIRL